MTMIGRRARRGRMALSAVACLLALLLTAMGATNVGAANLHETPGTCVDAATGQTQGGTAGASGRTEQGVAQDMDGMCATGGMTTTAYDGVTCSMVIPAGAAPGATIVVSELPAQTGESAVTNCRIEIVNPAGAKAATGNTADCVLALPSVSIIPEGAAGEAAGPGAGSAESGVSGGGSEANAIEVKPAAVAGSVQVCSAVMVEPANVAGASAEGEPAPKTSIDACGSFSSASGAESTANAGKTGTVTIDQGALEACSGTIAVEPAVDGQMVVCTVTDKAIVCPLQ
ncbi:MAG: hypothetical protein IT336_05030 [Thermomicrobiales bacterium]|nr:hypothetical protein [Thermomicrobiales bacterium]